MASTHLTKFLNAKLDGLHLSPLQAAETTVAKAEEHIKSLIGLPQHSPDHLEINAVSTNLSSLIRRLASKQAVIDEAIRQQRLKDSVQRKKELQDKLAFMENQIEVLEDTTTPRTKAQEDSGLTEEQRVAFIKKMEKHRRTRDKVRQTQIAKMQEEIQKIEEEEQQQREALQEEHHRTMMKQLQDTDKELRRREKERLLFKSQSDQAFKAVLKTKPRYVQIEERYEATVMLPKLEEKKQRLAEMRQRFAPMKLDDLQTHARVYEEMKRSLVETSQHRYFKPKEEPKHYYRGKLGEQADVESQQLKEQLRKQEQERRRLIEKQQQYGNLVTEMYRPELNSKLMASAKQSQLSIRNSRVSPRTTPTLSAKNIKLYDVKDVDFRASIEKPKFKPNPMVPKPKEKRKSPTQIDFLGDQRKRRDQMYVEEQPKTLDRISWSEAKLSESSRVQEELLGKADKQIERARRQGLTLSSVNPASIKNLQAQEAVDDAILDSLKAKLAVLNSI
jgi:hypothetical protein